jgi:hypothetical protein
MTATVGNIINKYKNVASANVIRAVQTASAKTGVDFAFLMEKASAESSFNPKAKAKSSSATGLFQFIENTWLNMVKEHGAKYGLEKMADKITVGNDGKPRVADSVSRKEILELRKNPEISALMAGEFCAGNKDYLEDNVNCDVGSTELYLAHFMGAGGAAKFLNSRDINGDAIGAQLFPQAAKANKNIFHDRATGRPRTLDQIYNLFDKKFNGGTPSPTLTATSTPPSGVAVSGSAMAPAAIPPVDPLDAMAQALPSFDDANSGDDIIWNDDPRFYPATARSGFSSPNQKLSADVMMTLLEIRSGKPESGWYNS